MVILFRWLTPHGKRLNILKWSIHLLHKKKKLDNEGRHFIKVIVNIPFFTEQFQPKLSREHSCKIQQPDQYVTGIQCKLLYVSPHSFFQSHFNSSSSNHSNCLSFLDLPAILLSAGDSVEKEQRSVDWLRRSAFSPRYYFFSLAFAFAFTATSIDGLDIRRDGRGISERKRCEIEGKNKPHHRHACHNRSSNQQWWLVNITMIIIQFDLCRFCIIISPTSGFSDGNDRRTKRPAGRPVP